MPSSEAPSKSEPQMGPYTAERPDDPNASSGNRPAAPPKVKSRLRWWFLLAAALVFLLGLALGPTILLKLTLARLAPAESGQHLRYDRARAGFLLRSAEVTELILEDRPGWVGSGSLYCRRLRLEGVSAWNLIKLLRRPGEIPPAGLFLAEEVNLDVLRFSLDSASAELEEVRARRLRVRPNQPLGELLSFARLETRNLEFRVGQENFSLGRLEARDLGPDFLAGLSLRDFHYQYRPEADSLEDFQLDALSLGGLSLEAIRRLQSGGTAGQVLWSLMAGCDTLDLVRATLNRSGAEALTIRSINFDSVSRPAGATGFLRRLDLSVDLRALSANSKEPFWTDLRDIAGDRFQADLNLELDYHPGSSRAELKSARLEAPELGRLELTGALSGVQPVKSHHSPSQLLLSTGGWSLEKLNLNFEDRGLAANFYRHLGRTVFRGAPSRQSAANIMNYVITPLARDLEYEQGLDNLPALVSEAEAFLEHPQRLRLSAEPTPPLPLMPVINSVAFMSLANQGKYDIIEKLRLTLAINDRAPIFVAVASGVFKENLPLAPRPMENAFDEETITEEDI